MKYSFIIATLEKSVPLLDSINELPKSIYNYEVLFATEIGKAKCRNSATKRATGNYLLFFDGDTWCYPEILIWMMFWITQYPERILCYPHDYYGLCCSRVLVITRENFYKIGGFNEFFHEAMDIDFGVRASRQGIPLSYFPKEWIRVKDGSENKFISLFRRKLDQTKLFLVYPKEFFKTYASASIIKLVRLFLTPNLLYLSRNIVLFISALFYCLLSPKFQSSLGSTN